MRADGTGAVNLTNTPNVDEHDGAWSPDGRHIAFSSGRSGNSDIYIMREDGTGIRQLTTTVSSDSQPRWSADGQQLVFVSDRDGVSCPGAAGICSDIFSMKVDGSSQTNLTKTAALDEYWPSWSPDGKRLLYRANPVPSDWRLMVANADGSGAVPLRPVDPTFIDDAGTWSPDGTTIAFSVRFDAGTATTAYKLFLINSDGSNQRLLSGPTPSASRRFVSYSPDGKSIVFSADGFNEGWGTYGEIEVHTRDLATGAETMISPRELTSSVESPQAWRR
jgi:TolB protein